MAVVPGQRLGVERGRTWVLSSSTDMCTKRPLTPTSPKKMIRGEIRPRDSLEATRPRYSSATRLSSLLTPASRAAKA